MDQPYRTYFVVVMKNWEPFELGPAFKRKRINWRRSREWIKRKLTSSAYPNWPLTMCRNCRASKWNSHRRIFSHKSICLRFRCCLWNRHLDTSEKTDIQAESQWQFSTMHFIHHLRIREWSDGMCCPCSRIPVHAYIDCGNSLPFSVQCQHVKV